MNEYKQALESLDQVLNVQSKHVKALYIKGKILSQSGETDEAIKVLSLCLQLDPDNTVFLHFFSYQLARSSYFLK